MGIPTLTPLASPPSRTSQSNDAFVAAMDAWLASQQTLVTEWNAAVDDFNNSVNGALVATSTSSIAVGTGAKSADIGTGFAFGAGARVICARTSDPAGTRMNGIVTSYSAGTLAFTVSTGFFTGSGTYTDWTITPAPDPQPLAFTVNGPKTGGYTAVLTDANSVILLTSGGATIPANASVAYPVGTFLIFKEEGGATQSIAITTDTMKLDGTAATGTRTLLAYGTCMAWKRDATTWWIGGDVI